MAGGHGTRTTNPNNIDIPDILFRRERGTKKKGKFRNAFRTWLDHIPQSFSGMKPSPHFSLSNEIFIISMNEMIRFFTFVFVGS